MKKRKHSKRNGNGKSKYDWLFKKPPEPVYLSREEIIRQIEEEAQEIRGVSAHKLLSSYKRGKLKNPGEVFHLIILSGLLKENDPIFA